MLEPEGDKDSRNVRESNDHSGSGDMMLGSGHTPDSPNDNNRVDQSSNLSGLKEWHIGVITFGGLSLLFCSMFIPMVSSSTIL